MPKKKDVIIDSNNKDIESIYQNIKAVIDRDRKNVYKTINFETVKGYWEIGRYIVEDEQHGKKRASKGDALLKRLSEKLTNEYGSGFDYSNVKRMKKFYLTFPKGDALSDKISWTQYRTLLKVTSDKARDFYINEIIKANYGTSAFRRISCR